MSKFRNPSSGEDHADAAGKHLSDARVLLDNNRYDGAGSLAGYVIECCFKCLHLCEKGEHPWGHDINQLGRDALEFAATVPSSRTARYVGGLGLTHPIYAYSEGSGWNESLRYQPEGKITEAESASWLAEAERVYQQTVGRMKMDGVV
jgi:hypothetical protein